MSSGKVGADDFIKRCGKYAFLERINQPLWEFSKQALSLDALLSTEESVKGVLRNAVLLPRMEVDSSLLDKIKGKTNFAVPLLRTALNAVLSQWESLKPKPEAGANEIIWERDRETIPHLYKRIAQILENDESVYTDPKLKTLITVDDALGTHNRLFQGKELSDYLTHKIDFQQGKWIDGIFCTVGYQQISNQLMHAFLCKNYQYAKKLRPLEFVTDSPCVVGGEIINEHGYHPAGMVYLSGNRIEPKYSFDKTERLFNSFPFSDDVSRVNAIGGTIGITFYLQELIGQHPMILIEGDDQNLGKSTLAKCMGYIALGHEIVTAGYHSNDEEFEKQIATHVKSSNAVIIDNVRARVVSSAVLERCITDSILNFRKLGKNEAIRRPNNFQFFMTLNHGMVSRDLAVRSLPIFLSSSQMKSRDEGFNPQEFVRDNRQEILSEFLGMLLVSREKRGIDA